MLRKGSVIESGTDNAKENATSPAAVTNHFSCRRSSPPALRKRMNTETNAETIATGIPKRPMMKNAASMGFDGPPDPLCPERGSDQLSVASISDTPVRHARITAFSQPTHRQRAERR